MKFYSYSRIYTPKKSHIVRSVKSGIFNTMCGIIIVNAKPPQNRNRIKRCQSCDRKYFSENPQYNS